MTQAITLDTPEQINAWVLMSRISQCHLHMDGFKVPGLLKWLKTNVPDCANTRTIKDAYPRLLDYCDTFGVNAPGGERCNYQVLATPNDARRGMYFDQGIFPDMEAIQSLPDLVAVYEDGRVAILRTMEKVRAADTSIIMEMGE